MPALAALLIVSGFPGTTHPTSRDHLENGQSLDCDHDHHVHRHAVHSAAICCFAGDGAQRGTLRITPVGSKWWSPSGYAARRIPLEQPAQEITQPLTVLHVYGSLFFAAARGLEEMLPCVDETTHAVVAISLRGQGKSAARSWPSCGTLY